MNRPLILASSSPRRQYLMKEVGFDFKVEKPPVEELFPENLPVDQVAKYLAELKAEYFRPSMREQIIVTADTVVILDGKILNKPADRGEAIAMLSSLSGNTHTVMTGVRIVSKEKEESFDEATKVTFEKLSQEQIEFYIDRFQPYDKAGSYGAQDCLPPGINPCSEEEMQFLRGIGREDLAAQTVAHADGGIVIIGKVTGSYFNVMGLPVHKVYERLKQWPRI